MRQRLTDIESIDFFSSPARKPVDSLLAQIETKLRKVPIRKTQQRGDYSGRTWVTRKGIHVDRIASAWLIRRFVDPAAKFKFVPGKGYRPEPGEIRFDMFDAEFTHEGERCTFEVLSERLNIDDSRHRSEGFEVRAAGDAGNCTRHCCNLHRKQGRPRASGTGSSSFRRPVRVLSEAKNGVRGTRPLCPLCLRG